MRAEQSRLSLSGELRCDVELHVEIEHLVGVFPLGLFRK